MGETQEGCHHSYLVSVKPANIGDVTATYEKIGLTTYENGMLFGGKYYVGGSIGLYNNTTGSGPKNEDLISNIVTNYPDEDVNIQLFDRNIYADNCWNTLCLPFSLTAEQLAASPLAGFTVEELDVQTDAPGYCTGYYNNTLYLFFNKATSIEAGKPYILRKLGDSNISNPVFENVRVVSGEPTGARSADRTVTFLGRYASLYYGSANQSVLLLGASNNLYYPKPDSFLGACRAYFQLNGITAEDIPVNGVKMFFGDDDDPDGIESLTPTLSEGEGEWYDLNGRKLNGKPTQRGIYINNGNKIIIK